MALAIKVKASRINNLSDARYCAAMGVEMMGFLIDSNSDDAVSPELFNAITGWISGIELVGEIDSSEVPDLSYYVISKIQVTNPNLLPQVSENGLKAILLINLSKTSFDDAEKMMSDYKNEVSYFLIENNNSVDLSGVEAAKIKHLASIYPIILGYGITKDNLNSILDLGIEAISIYGSSEERPGYKSYDEMADILEALEVD